MHHWSGFFAAVFLWLALMTVCGACVVRIAGGYQLRTRPEFASLVSAFLRPAAQKLSRQVLQILTNRFLCPVGRSGIDDEPCVDQQGIRDFLCHRNADQTVVAEAVAQADAGSRPRVVFHPSEHLCRRIAAR